MPGAGDEDYDVVCCRRVARQNGWICKVCVLFVFMCHRRSRSTACLLEDHILLSFGDYVRKSFHLLSSPFTCVLSAISESPFHHLSSILFSISTFRTTLVSLAPLIITLLSPWLVTLILCFIKSPDFFIFSPSRLPR